MERHDERCSVGRGTRGDGVLVGSTEVRQIGRDEVNVVGLIPAA
jgi:hypothetical protein